MIEMRRAFNNSFSLLIRFSFLQHLRTLADLSKILKHFETKGLNYLLIYKYTLYTFVIVTFVLLWILCFDAYNFVDSWEFLKLVKVYAYIAPFIFNAYNMLGFCINILIIRYCFLLINREISIVNQILPTPRDQLIIKRLDRK